MASVEAVERTLALLEQFSEAPDGLGVSEMAARTGLAPSTVHRYLAVLTERGIVEQDRDRRYRLTARLYFLGLAGARGFDLETQARPALERLAELSRETVCLMVRDGRHAVCIAQIESRHQLQIAARVGNRQDLRVGATSRLLLAHTPVEVQDAILALPPLPRYTKRTVRDPDAIRATLADIRRDGHYISRGELDEGVSAVAAPVRNRHGEVSGAVVVAAPESRAGEATLDRLVDLVTEAAHDISNRLGHSPTRRLRERSPM